MPDVQIMSDIHVEFFRDGFEAWLAGIEVTGDVLVLAGDIDVGPQLTTTLCAFARRWPHVVFVPGNHEYYHASPKETIGAIRAACAAAPNLVWLDHEVVEVSGVTFGGATLWYSPPPDPSTKRWMGDYHAIRNFEPWVYREHQRALAFLSKAKADVIVTHHIPTALGVAPEFRSSVMAAMNHYFCHDMTELIRRRGPKLWIYGHTHRAMDFVLGRTQLVCNPKGYPGEARTDQFDPSCSVTLSARRKRKEAQG